MVRKQAYSQSQQLRFIINIGVLYKKWEERPFPKDKDVRKKREVALRDGFTVVICCQHFKQSDFDRTGQIVRLRDGVIASVFSFLVHLQKLEKGRSTSTSRRAQEFLSVASQDSQGMATSHPRPQPNDDDGYALPASPTALKTRLNEALARVESLQREKKKKRAKIRWKMPVCSPADSWKAVL
ncbi:LOW QUALITY PROTEIN: uncharacterized protein AB9W97_015460 [Spinachia spinachia]